ncbi:MAG: DUF1080 domain-containing protein [Planctomycetota bacterium]|nr:DUF1080 domain-containing protein [Planctomycetota bacterium]
MLRLISLSILLVLATLSTRVLSVPSTTSDDFVSLFDGKSLKGWHGDKRLWKVQDGVIVGTSDGSLKSNTFLISDHSYENFVLKISFQLEGNNSGVQFRSSELDDYGVRGYQADIAPEYWGLLYEEKGRGILQKPQTAVLRQALVKPEGWNDYVITARGNHIEMQLNGTTVVRYEEKQSDISSKGIFALQLHTGDAMKARFKNIKIKKLD